MNNLPNEILLHCFSYLQSQDFSSITTINQKFHKVSKHKTLWRKTQININKVVQSLRIYRKSPTSIVSLLTDFSLNFPNFFHFTIEPYQQYSLLSRCSLLDLLAIYPNLESLRISISGRSEWCSVFCNTITKFKQLKCLDICIYGNLQLIKTITTLPSLQELHVSLHMLTLNPDQFTQLCNCSILKSLTLWFNDGSYVQQYGAEILCNAKSLRKLVVSAFEFESNELLNNVLLSLTRLTTLELTNVKYVNESTLNIIIENFPSLQHFVLDYSVDETDDEGNELQSEFLLTNESLLFISLSHNCKQLRNVKWFTANLTVNNVLEFLCNSLSTLQSLQVQCTDGSYNESTLSTLSTMKLDNLTTLCIESRVAHNIVRINSEVLGCIASMAPRLQKLKFSLNEVYLQHIRSIHFLLFLRSLTLEFVPSDSFTELTSVICEAMTQLQSLDLSGGEPTEYFLSHLVSHPTLTEVRFHDCSTVPEELKCNSAYIPLPMRKFKQIWETLQEKQMGKQLSNEDELCVIPTGRKQREDFPTVKELKRKYKKQMKNSITGDENRYQLWLTKDDKIDIHMQNDAVQLYNSSSVSQSPPACFSFLLDNLLSHCFTFLSFTDAISASQCCQHWLQTFRTKKSTQEIIDIHKIMSQIGIELLKKQYSLVQSFRLPSSLDYNVYSMHQLTVDFPLCDVLDLQQQISTQQQYSFIEVLQSLSHLHTVYIDVPINDEIISSLLQMSHLWNLHLRNDSSGIVQHSALTQVARSSKLVSLRLYDRNRVKPDDCDFTVIGQSTTLKSLELRHCPYTSLAEIQTIIGSLKRLAHLVLQEKCDNEIVDCIVEKLTNLESLSILGSPNIDSTRFLKLSSLPKLSSFHYRTSSVLSLELVFPFLNNTASSLQHLKLDCNCFGTSSRYSSRSSPAPSLKLLLCLQSLDLGDILVDVDLLSVLVDHTPNLKKIHMKLNQTAQPQQLNVITRWKVLEELSLPSLPAQCFDDMLPLLCSLPSLRSIDFSFGFVPLRFIASLASCSSLSLISVCFFYCDTIPSELREGRDSTLFQTFKQKWEEYQERVKNGNHRLMNDE